MTYPKIKKCPSCGKPGDELSVYTYDSGGRHVECNDCNYLGPCGGSILAAIRLHNQTEKFDGPLLDGLNVSDAADKLF